MGLFLCDLCDEQLGSITPHVCDPVKIEEHINKLKERAYAAEKKTENMRNAVFMLLQSLPSLVGENILVETKWLRDLWTASGAVYYKPGTMEQFHQKWMAMHNILRWSFNLFRSRGCYRVVTPLEKLKKLREACDNAKEVMGYQNSKLDLSPEDLV